MPVNSDDFPVIYLIAIYTARSTLTTKPAPPTVQIGEKEATMSLIENYNDTRCPHCNTPAAYSDHYDGYDAFYCPNCNIWLESQCESPTCDYCAHRPKNPILFSF